MSNQDENKTISCDNDSRSSISSIDGSIRDFILKQGIEITGTTLLNSFGRRKHKSTQDIVNTSISSEVSLSQLNVNDVSDSVDVFTPILSKINEILVKEGYHIVECKDSNIESIDNWSDSVLKAILSIIDENRRFQGALQHMSISSRNQTKEVEGLNTRINDLLLQLNDLEKKEKSVSFQLIESGMTV